MGVYFIMNELLVAKAWLLKMAIRVEEYALYTNPVEPLVERAAVAMSTLGVLLWSEKGAPLVTAALGVIGLWGLLLYLGGRTRRVWGLLSGTTLILVVTGIGLAQGPSAVRSALPLARDITTQVVSAVDRVGSRGDTPWGLVPRSGDAVWRALVYQPWVAGELSEQGMTQFRTTDGLDGGMFLAHNVSERQNICLYNFSQGAVLCPWWQVDFLPRRMLLALWTTLAVGVYAGTVIALSGGIILAQLTALLSLALAPVWLLIAVWWPEGGSRLLNRLLFWVMGALVTQVVLAATLVVLLSLSDAVVTTFTTAGWMPQSLMLSGLAGLTYRYRYAWLTSLDTIVGRLERSPIRTPVKLGAMATQRRRSGVVSCGDSRAVGEAIPMWAGIHADLIPQYALSDRTQRSEEADPRQRELRAVQREVFRQQMLVLRDHFRIRQQLVLRERATGLEPGVGGKSGNGQGQTIERRSDRVELLRLPTQRPRP